MSEFTPATPLPSRIAALVHSHFDALPSRSKPSIFPDGSREWVPMTGIVAVKGIYLKDQENSEYGYGNLSDFI